MTPPGKAKVDLLDPVQVALEMTELRGEQAGLSQQLNQAISNMGGTLQAIQGDIRSLQDKVQTVANQQHDIQAHSTGLERLAKAIEHHVQDNKDWREAHTQENTKVADKVTYWRGMVMGIGAVFTLLTGTVVFIVQDGFAQATTERVRLERQHQSDIDRLERTIDRQAVDIRQLQQQRGVIAP